MCIRDRSAFTGLIRRLVREAAEVLRKLAALVAALSLALMAVGPATAQDPMNGQGGMVTAPGVAGMPPGMPPMKAFDQTKRQAAAKANVAKGAVNNMEQLSSGAKAPATGLSPLAPALNPLCGIPSTTLIDYSGTCVPNYANSVLPGGGGPSVTFGGPGTGAVAIASVGAGGAVTGITVTSGGSG